jgi:hypothetical protein
VAFRSLDRKKLFRFVDATATPSIIHLASLHSDRKVTPSFGQSIEHEVEGKSEAFKMWKKRRVKPPERSNQLKSIDRVP